MSQEYYKILTNYSISESMELLSDLVKDKAPDNGFFAKKPLLIGSLSDSGFKATWEKGSETMKFEAHLTEISGKTEIKFSVNIDSMHSGIAAFGITIFYVVLFMGFIIKLTQDPTNLSTYIWTAVLSPLPYLIGKGMALIYASEPNPKMILRKLNRKLNGKLEKTTTPNNT